jgi:hypothetical protein
MPKLLELVAEMRPDWDLNELAGAMTTAAMTPDWTWDRTFSLVADLLVDEKAGPWDLAAAIRSPFEKRRPDDPSEVWREARAALEARSAS